MEHQQIQLGSTGPASRGKTRGDAVMEIMEQYRKEGRVFVCIMDIGRSSNYLLSGHKVQKEE